VFRHQAVEFLFDFQQLAGMDFNVGCLTAQTALLEAVSPQQILERGFSVVKNTRGQVIRNADVLKQGQKLHITFADGETDVRVTKEQAQRELFD